MFNNLVKIRGGQPRPKQAQRKFYRLLDQTNLMYFQDCLSMAQRSRHLSSWSSIYFKQCKTSVLKCWFITGRFSSSFYFTKTILLTNSPEVFSVFVMALFSNNLLILFFFVCAFVLVICTGPGVLTWCGIQRKIILYPFTIDKISLSSVKIFQWNEIASMLVKWWEGLL